MCIKFSRKDSQLNVDGVRDCSPVCRLPCCLRAAGYTGRTGFPEAQLCRSPENVTSLKESDIDITLASCHVRRA